MSHRGPAFWGHQDVNSWRKCLLKCPWVCSESSHWHDLHSPLQQKQECWFVSTWLGVATKQRKLMSLEEKADLSPFYCAQHPHLFFSLGTADKGSWELMRSKDKTHTPNGHSSCASGPAWAGSCWFGVDQKPREKWVSPSTLLCGDGAPGPLAVLTAFSTNFSLNGWYELDCYEHQCP